MRMNTISVSDTTAFWNQAYGNEEGVK